MGSKMDFMEGFFGQIGFLKIISNIVPVNRHHNYTFLAT